MIMIMIMIDPHSIPLIYEVVIDHHYLQRLLMQSTTMKTGQTSVYTRAISERSIFVVIRFRIVSQLALKEVGNSPCTLSQSNTSPLQDQTTLS
jgi:hypothetical protein